jgi:hypothetical protein
MASRIQLRACLKMRGGSVRASPIKSSTSCSVPCGNLLALSLPISKKLLHRHRSMMCVEQFAGIHLRIVEMSEESVGEEHGCVIPDEGVYLAESFGNVEMNSAVECFVR